MVICACLFLLLLASVRFFSIFDSFDSLIYWFSALIIFNISCFVFLWRRNGFFRSAIAISIFLVSSHFFLKNPSLVGYSLDYKGSETEDNSNLPTIQHRDFIISKHFNLKFQPGSMYGIKVNNKVFRKRLHGMPGDKVHICNYKVYINGFMRSVNDHWQRTAVSDFSDCDKVNHVLKLQQGEYYFLGDNTYKSYDSRSFGTINEQQIIAKSLYVIRGDNDILNLSVQFN